MAYKWTLRIQTGPIQIVFICIMLHTKQDKQKNPNDTRVNKAKHETETIVLSMQSNIADARGALHSAWEWGKPRAPKYYLRASPTIIYIYIYIDSHMAPDGACGFVQSKVRSSEVSPNVR